MNLKDITIEMTSTGLAVVTTRLYGKEITVYEKLDSLYMFSEDLVLTPAQKRSIQECVTALENVF